MNDRSWIALLALVVLLAVTATLWVRFRRLPSMRPWLVRHVIGNFVLAIGLFVAWRYDLALFYYAAIAVSVFVMWIWGNRKLRVAVQKNKSENFD
jgi:hydrogenase/urease accessory protein HupE